MTNKVIIIDYCKFKDITGISDENFKKRTKKEKIDRLLKNGYVVQNIYGIGIKAIFECEISDNFKLQKEIECKVGLSVKHPKVMDTYLNLLISKNGIDFMFMSDRQISEFINNENIGGLNYTTNTLKKYIYDCRMDLVDSGWMNPIIKNKNTKNKTDRVYKIINIKDGLNKDISLEEYNYLYSNIYYPYILSKVKELKDNNININKNILSNIAKEAKSKVFDVVKGVPTVIYKKDFNIEKFIKEICGNNNNLFG